MSNLHVSVVIPVYNGGEDLRKCLKAINESSYRSHECILVDDASTDGMTDEIALMKISGCSLRYMYSAVVPERAAPITRNVGIFPLRLFQFPGHGEIQWALVRKIPDKFPKRPGQHQTE